MRYFKLSPFVLVCVVTICALTSAEPTQPAQLCTWAPDADWATQGNGFARTNASSTSMQRLCALTQTWTHEFQGQVQAISAVIADYRVLVTSTDSIHCFNQFDGTHFWSEGGFPYILGDLRSALTVDEADNAVYCGGAAAQSFTKFNLTTGAVVWSRNVTGSPLNPGQTNWSPTVIIGNRVYFTQETGYVYALDQATGADVPGWPLLLPDAPAAVPYNALTSDGVKLWVGTANTLGADGSIHQIDQSGTIDWSLSNPGALFYPGNAVYFDPEGFPGSMAYEDGILYYHSHIRNDGNGFAHFPQSGSIGAIDVTIEDGSGSGILWVNDAPGTTVSSPGLTPSSLYDYAGPAVGPDLVYLNSRGFFSGPEEQDGVSAWDKILGGRAWYKGYTGIGNNCGIEMQDDVRGDAPVTTLCQFDGTPYLFVGNAGGVWRLMNGITGEIEWERHFTGPVRQTAVNDSLALVVTRDGGPLAGGGSITAFFPLDDRPRLQLDSLHVVRRVQPGTSEGIADITDALRNVGCAPLSISAYTVVAPPGEPLFLTVNSATGVVPSLTSKTLDYIAYDASALALNACYTNYVEVHSDDLDYYPQGAVSAVPGVTTPGVPVITVTLDVGCLEEERYITLGQGKEWITNYGLLANGGSDGFQVGSSDLHFRGSLCATALDNTKWAIEWPDAGLSDSPPSEWAPALPCAVDVEVFTCDHDGRPIVVEKTSYTLQDLASDNGFFPPDTRQMDGLVVEVQRVGAHDVEFGDFGLVKVKVTNEVDGLGDMIDLRFGIGQDWNLGGPEYVQTYATDNSYAFHNGPVGNRGTATLAVGNARLDAPADCVCPLTADALGHFWEGTDGLPHAAEIMSCTYPLCGTQSSDMGVYHSLIHIPVLAEGASEVFYYCTWQLENGVNGVPWSDNASFDAAVDEIVDRARDFSGIAPWSATAQNGTSRPEAVKSTTGMTGWRFDYAGCQAALPGDVTGDGNRTSADIIYMVNYIFKGDDEPKPCAANGDVDCSGGVSSSDIIYYVNYVFKGGSAPCDIFNESSMQCE